MGPATGSGPGGAQCRISVCECVPWASVPSVYFQDTLPPTPQSTMRALGLSFAGKTIGDVQTVPTCGPVSGMDEGALLTWLEVTILWGTSGPNYGV